MSNNECTKCIHHPVCKTAESCDGYVSGCEHFKEQKQVRMDVREKLVELFAVTSLEFEDAVTLADHLIAHGVTVQSDKDINVLINADRIRAMSDETLAMQLVQVVKETIKALTDLDVPYEILNEIGSCILEKLKQPADRGEEDG